MLIVVAREAAERETRVALVPEFVPELRTLGYRIAVQSGSGRGARCDDTAYAAAGAAVLAVGSAAESDALAAATVVLSVGPLDRRFVARLPRHAATLSFFPVEGRADDLADRTARGVTTFAMDRVPRISRAQSMDALTSQALIVGYRGAVVAAERSDAFFPLAMTAAGTIEPARVLVLGAGVAGLEAIATCRRMGATVSAYDVRASSAEEIRSLGAEFLELGLPPLEGPTAYARELSDERSAEQRARLAPHVAATDVLITTASVPGRRAPVLVSANMVAAMRPGAVVVDLAAEAGGNVEGVIAGHELEVGGVRLWGGAEVAAQLPGPASRLYARNLVAVLALMTRDGVFAPDPDDPIVAALELTDRAEEGR